MLYDFLQPYFIRPEGFLAKDIPFDLGSEEKVRAYRKDAAVIARKVCAMLPSAVVVAISTHTDEDRGDLYTSQEGDSGMAAKIQQVRRYWPHSHHDPHH